MSRGRASSDEIRILDEQRRPFFTPQSLADYLAISDRMVRKLLHDGMIPSYKIGAARRIDPDDVDAYLARVRDGGRGGRRANAEI